MPIVTDGRARDVAAQLFDALPVMRCAAHACVQAEAMRKYAALKVGIEFVIDEARQRPAFLVTLGDVGLPMRGHRAIQRRLLRAVALPGAFACG